MLPGWLLDRWVLRRGGQKQLDDLAAIVYTRGTTGPPKPVMLSHRNLVASVSALVKTLDPLPRDRLLATLPLLRMHRFRLRALGAAFDRHFNRFSWKRATSSINFPFFSLSPRGRGPG